MTQLQKTLGPFTIWGLGVGYVISGAYFGWNLGLPVGGSIGLLAATAVATVLYATFVLGYAELACAMPRAGGAFVYTSRAFGPHVGFIGGLAQLVEYVIAPPAIAFSIGAYINQAMPGVPIFETAVITYVIFTLINAAGVTLSARFELLLTVVAVIELVIFGAVALPSFSWQKFSAEPLPQGWSGAFAAVPFAMWFYLAIEGIANIAEEAKQPQRDLPRGFLWAMATLVVLAAITLFGAVGVDGWRTAVYPDPASSTMSDSPLPLAIKHVLSADHPMYVVLTSVGLIGLLASFHGILIIGSRAILELGRVRYAPAILGRVHPRTRTPIAALATNLGVGLIALFTGKTSDVILLAVFGALTLYVLSSAAVIVLRRREPDMARPYRTPGYPYVPAIACLLSLIALGAMVWSQPTLALIFAGILAGGWLLFVVFVPADRRTAFSDTSSTNIGVGADGAAAS